MYAFTLDAPGTLWWHSHTEMQRGSVHGAIIISGDEGGIAPYNGERTIILNDWFHADARDQFKGVTNPSFRWVGSAQSLLANGRGHFKCPTKQDTKGSPPTCVEGHKDAGPYVMDVEPGKTYRLRLVGAASLYMINVGIERHGMSLIEAETTLLKPMHVNYLDVGQGQSYSVLLRTMTRRQLEKIPRNNGKSDHP